MDLTPKPLNILLHLGLYVSVLIIMKYLYVDPVLRVLRKRDALTEGRKTSGEELLQKLSAMKADVEQRTQVLKIELEEKRNEELRLIQREVDDKIARVRKEMETKIAANETKLRAEFDEGRKRIPVLSEELGRQMAEAVLDPRKAA